MKLIVSIVDSETDGVVLQEQDCLRSLFRVCRDEVVVVVLVI